MEIKTDDRVNLIDAVKQLSALAHEGRLQLLRLLIQAGPDGLAATNLANKAGGKLPTVSAQLLVLTNAGMVTSTRAGRQIIYRADYERMTDLLRYLTLDCCAGSQFVCKPLLPDLQRAMSNGCPTDSNSV
jgi:DNA-binding transcriptional ArsR family regulator